MKLAATLLAIVFVATGCDLDSVMGRDTAGAPVAEPQKLDCDLIFPPASVLP